MSSVTPTDTSTTSNNEKQKFAKHAGLTTIANLTHALAQWLLLVIVVKHFNAVILGNLVLSLSIASPLFLLFSFKLRSLIVTDYHNQHHLEQYLHARLLAQLFVVMVIAAITPFILAQVLPVIIISVVIFKISDGICELCYSYLHKQQQYNKVAYSQVSRSIFSICTLLIASYFTESISTTFLAWCSANALFALIDLYLISGAIKTNEQRQLTLIKTVFSKSALLQSLALYRQYWPIGLSITFGAMFVYLPNYVLAYYHDQQMVGHFAAISYFLVAGGVFINSLSQAATPKLSILFNQKKYRGFLSATKALMLIGAVIGLLGIGLVYLIGEWLLTLIYNADIAQYSTELMLIFAASALRYSYVFLGAALNVLRCFNRQVFVYASGTLTLAICLIVLVPNHGAKGAAIAMILGCGIEMLVMLTLFKMAWQKQTNTDHA